QGADHDVEAVRQARAVAEREWVDALQSPQRHLEWVLRPRKDGGNDVHADDQVGTHVAHRRRGDRVAHAAVDEDVVAQPERPEYPGRREARPDGVAQVAIAELDRGSPLDVGGDGAEWD